MSNDTSPQPPSPPPPLLPPELRAFHGLVMRQVMGNLSGLTGRHDLTPAQLSTLFRVRAQPELAISEIGMQLGLSSGATSHLIERLVKRGLLKRSELHSDRRQRRVSLTAEGTAFLHEVDGQLSVALADLIAQVPPPQLAALVAALADVLPWLMVEKAQMVEKS
ncbi:MarR family winged helix-turn-helix transcriptional regulator [Deinococcus sp.]|uniref:MarR family winged helix-turn-helix transcriptional regulator n=1 Tax=Deinococcus sp. TaxID=47478 RepID=UPI003CC508ED